MAKFFSVPNGWYKRPRHASGLLDVHADVAFAQQPDRMSERSALVERHSGAASIVLSGQKSA